MRRSQPKRDWTDARAKVEAEGRCRLCGITRGLQAAHTIGRVHDAKRGATRWVDPDGIVPLCEVDHQAYDRHEVDLLGYLTAAEEVFAVRTVGLEQARRRLAPSDYRRDIDAARVEARLAA